METLLHAAARRCSVLFGSAALARAALLPNVARGGPPKAEESAIKTRAGHAWLAEVTAVHWHGVHVQIAMDGVPHLTQEPNATGATFVYEFVFMPPANKSTSASSPTNPATECSTATFWTIRRQG
jgi:hypothetical protein